MERLHIRDFVEDCTKDRWQSLLRLYTSGTLGKLQTCPSWTTGGTQGLWLGKSPASDEHHVGDFSRSSQVSDPSGGAQRNNAGTGRC